MLIDDVQLHQGHIQIHPLLDSDADPEPEALLQPEQKQSLILLPFDIELKRLLVRDFVLTTPDVRVAVGRLQAAANWQGSRLQLEQATGSDVDVALLPSPTSGSTKKEPAAAPLAKPFDARMIQQQIESLPKVFLPFQLEVMQFKVQGARYHQTGFDTGLFDVQASAGFEGVELSVTQLQVRHSWGDLQLKGQMTFQGLLSDAVRAPGSIQGTLAGQTVDGASGPRERFRPIDGSADQIGGGGRKVWP